MSLNHSEVYSDGKRIAVRLPMIEALRAYGAEDFPLVEDPRQTGKTTFVGMFVLRPGRNAWTAPVHTDGKRAVHDGKGWTYNVKGVDGGAIIANGNVVDAYRLALQYAISDAVIVGSTTVATEGTPNSKNGGKGYIWHAYGPTNWGHLKAADPDLLEKLMEERRLLQREGFLSGRKYPAQIVVTQSGRESSPDILEASIFHELDIDGKAIEAYILTSEKGAEHLRERAGRFGLESRIDEILIPLSPPRDASKIDLGRLPKILYDRYGIKIANHDGGATVLSEFSKAGILPQMNLTLMRNGSVHDVLSSSDRVEPVVREKVLADFEGQTARFFGTGDGSVPEGLEPAQILMDEGGDAAIVTFDARSVRGFR